MRVTKKLSAFFYATSGGKEPVRDWLLDLSDQDRLVIGRDIATAEFGWPVGMPVCKPMGESLFEIRSALPGRRIARVMFAPIGGRMILLHGFIKKSQKTPQPDLALARKRMKEYTNHD